MSALEDEPPLVLRDGGIIRESWHAELGAIVRDAREARAWIAGLEERERTRTGISSLRVRFNRVFGYGIEVTHAQTARVPAEYVRRQTLSGAERYVTPELKEYEAKVLGADERRRRLEYELFEDVRRRVAARAEDLMTTARALARLDVFASLAEVAHTAATFGRSWTRATRWRSSRPPPRARGAGRSPVTPNDLALDHDARIVILTARTCREVVYLRQRAHRDHGADRRLVLPREARIGWSIACSRVGAQDSRARPGTFLVEMIETATVLNNGPTEPGAARRGRPGDLDVRRSRDRLGGGGPCDSGHGAKGVRASFHELTRLAGRLGGVRNPRRGPRVERRDLFLHKVQPGGPTSYGIQVARLAGLPATVVARSKALLAELEGGPLRATRATPCSSASSLRSAIRC